MRVVHIIGHLRLGAGRYIVDMAEEQIKTFGHDVVIVVGDDVDASWSSDRKLLDELANFGAKIESIGDFFTRNKEHLRKAAQRLTPIIDSDDCVVHAHSAMPALTAHTAGAKKIVATCHGWNLDRKKEYDIDDANAYKLCGAVITPSMAWGRMLEEILFVKGAIVIPVGIKTSRFPHVDTNERPHTPLRLVTTCELTERKGVDVIIEAMPYVWKVYSDCELHIMGTGDLEKKLKGMAGKIDTLGTRISFHGHIPFPYGEYGEYDIFCIASRSDNYPVAVMEAMLAGLAVVGTDAGGIPEMIKGGDCGVVVEKKSPEKFGKAVLKLFSGEYGDMEKLGGSGEEFVRGNLDVKKVVESVQKVYGSV